MRAAGGDGRRRLLLQDGPVEDVVVLVVEGAEQDAEQLAQVHVVGRLLEAQAAAVVQVHGKLCRVTLGGDTIQYTCSPGPPQNAGRGSS